MTANIHQEITDRIIAQLEKGVAPWVRPWSETKGGNEPHNVTTGVPYKGTNKVLLWIEMQSGARPLPRFLTFKQARDAGGTVRGGEKGIPLFKLVTTGERIKDGVKEDGYMFPKYFTVFNVAQCDGLPAKFTDPDERILPRNKGERDPEIEDFVKTTGVKVVEDDDDHDGTEAFYSPRSDFVHMPLFKNFETADKYYDTLFHELIHASGSKNRLNRAELANYSGDKATRASEELIAELGGAFLAAEFGIDVIRHNSSYIASWLKQLRNDNKAIFKAASGAQKAVDFFRGLALQDQIAEAA